MHCNRYNQSLLQIIFPVQPCWRFNHEWSFLICRTMCVKPCPPLWPHHPNGLTQKWSGFRFHCRENDFQSPHRCQRRQCWFRELERAEPGMDWWNIDEKLNVWFVAWHQRHLLRWGGEGARREGNGKDTQMNENRLCADTTWGEVDNSVSYRVAVWEEFSMKLLPNDNRHTIRVSAPLNTERSCWCSIRHRPPEEKDHNKIIHEDECHLHWYKLL